MKKGGKIRKANLRRVLFFFFLVILERSDLERSTQAQKPGKNRFLQFAPIFMPRQVLPLRSVDA